MRLIRLAVALAVSLILAPLAAEGQAGKVHRIGVLSSVPGPSAEGLRQGLRELGYTEGRNILIEWRWTEGKAERVSELASELVRAKPDLIVTSAPQPSLAAKAETTTIPIVFSAVGDPVGVGLVASLAKPGGNITGLATFVPGGFSTKGAELLKEAVPRLSRLAVLMNPTNTMHQRVLSTELAPASGQLRMVSSPSKRERRRNSRAPLRRRPARGLTRYWCSEIRWPSPIGRESWNSQRGTGCPPCTSSANTSKLAVLWPTVQAFTTSAGARPPT